MSLRKLLITHSRIEEATKAIAAKIKGNYASPKDLCFIPVLQGSIPFFVDLSTYLGFHEAVVDYVGVSSYNGENQQNLHLYKSVKKECVSGKICFIVDDILDSGTTMSFLTNYLFSLGAAEVVPVVLLKRIVY
jgi:hypoxanthine phosphoribosyltransferase